MERVAGVAEDGPGEVRARFRRAEDAAVGVFDHDAGVREIRGQTAVACEQIEDVVAYEIAGGPKVFPRRPR